MIQNYPNYRAAGAGAAVQDCPDALLPGADETEKEGRERSRDRLLGPRCRQHNTLARENDLPLDISRGNRSGS